MFLVLAVVPSLITGIIAAFLAAGMSVEQSEQELRSLMNERSKRIKIYMRNKVSDAEKIASNPRLSGIPLSIKYKDRLNKELEIFAAGHDYYDILLADSNGLILASAKKESDLGNNIIRGKMFESTELRAKFMEVKQSGKAVVSKYEFYAPSDSYAMFIIAPVKDAEKPRGYMVFQINNAEIDELVEDSRQPGKTTEILFGVKSADSAVFITNPEKIKGGAFSKKIDFNNKLGTPIQEAVKCNQGEGVRIDYFGVKVLAAWGCEELTGWGIVVKRSYSEVMRPVRDTVVLFLFVMLFTAAAAVAVAYLMAKNIAEPVYKIAEAAKKAGDGDFNSKVDVKSKGEMGMIASIFNKMTDELKIQVGKIKEMNAILNLEIEKKQEYMAELERSNRDLEQFAYVASHDLQEPLRAVAGYTQLLQKKLGDNIDDETRLMVDNTVKGTERMKKLINDLLAFSRVGSKGKDFKDVDMEMIFDSVVYGFGDLIGFTGAVVMKRRLPVIKADETLMALLLQNLIGNALKFKKAEPAEVIVSCEEGRTEYVFSVKDNGIGIEPQYYERIFVIFQRLNSRKDYPGTGIGLSICKRIVERHKGRIWVESIPGQGSVFYFTIPKGD